METNDRLLFALESSQDEGQYPDIFSDDLGKDFHLETKPEYFPVIATPRLIRMKISSFIGICGGAKHYYAEIQADGIKICSKEIRNGKENIITHSGYVCEEYAKLPREKKDIWDSYYSIEVVRPITQEMINANPGKWKYCGVGSMTNAFDTKESALSVAQNIVNERFQGEWDVVIDDLT